MDFIFNHVISSFFESDPDFLVQLGEVLANPEYQDFFDNLSKTLAGIYGLFFAVIAGFFGFVIFLVCDIGYDIVKKLISKRKLKKLS